MKCNVFSVLFLFCLPFKLFLYHLLFKLLLPFTFFNSLFCLLEINTFYKNAFVLFFFFSFYWFDFYLIRSCLIHSNEPKIWLKQIQKGWTEPNVNLLFGIILDLKYNKETEIRKISKRRRFAEPVKINFSN